MEISLSCTYAYYYFKFKLKMGIETDINEIQLYCNSD